MKTNKGSTNKLLGSLFILLAPFHLTAQSKAENATVEIKASASLQQSLLQNGYVQVREYIYEGTYLRLKEDLGLKSWLRPEGSISANFYNKNIFTFSYSETFFTGSKTLKNQTWYNGTLLEANSQADIKKSFYRSFEIEWQARIYHWSNNDLYLRTGIQYERLEFYVDATISENSPIRETFERFWKQQLPLPFIGMASVHRLTGPFQLKSEFGFTYLPITKTWMNEGGRISIRQSNFDASCLVEYRYKHLSVEGGLWFEHFKLLEESTEDTNDFLLNSGGYKVAVGVVF